MRTVELDPRVRALVALERIVDRCVPALMIFRCCNCSHTYRGSTLTPHICPSCGSDEDPERGRVSLWSPCPACDDGRLEITTAHLADFEGVDPSIRCTNCGASFRPSIELLNVTEKEEDIP